MTTSSGNSAVRYIEAQIDAVRDHALTALGSFDAKAIHQTRVATRRLKAGLDLLRPLVDDENVETLGNVGRKLRRRLGPLRDLDVMIDHLNAHSRPEKLRDAARWLGDRLLAEREQARGKDVRRHKPAFKLLSQFDEWQILRPKLEQAQEAADVLLIDAMHVRFDEFARQADMALDEQASPGSVDVHQLRIEGKALRYTLEIADAQGLNVPKTLSKTFKRMQESLGAWHDCVVLAEVAARCWAEARLAHHSPALASGVLDLARIYQSRSTQHLRAFGRQWKHSGVKSLATLREAFPLTRSAVTPVRKGHDPLGSLESRPPATPSSGDPAAAEA